eukprot:7008531-Prymnesium_polylepis.1
MAPSTRPESNKPKSPYHPLAERQLIRKYSRGLDLASSQKWSKGPVERIRVKRLSEKSRCYVLNSTTAIPSMLIT